MKKKYLILGILSLVFVVNTILVICGKTTAFDNYVYNLVRSLECGFFDKYFVFIAKFGNVSVVIGVVGLLILLFRNRNDIILTILAVLSAVTNKTLKHIIQRSRPNVLKLIKQGGYSYPSGHSMISVSVYGYLLYLAYTKINNSILKWLCSIILFIFILSIGVSRIYVGVHYASDVLGGFTLALIELILVINFTKKRFRGN